MIHLLRLFLQFFAAAMATFIFACIVHSQQQLAELVAWGIALPWQIRLSSTLDDMLELLSGFAPMVTVALLLGWSIGGLSKRYLSLASFTVFPVTGACALVVMHLAISPQLNLSLMANSNSALALLLQSVAGLAGGWLFAYFRSIYR